MSAMDRILAWLGLAAVSAFAVVVAFPGGIHRVQEHYAERFGFSPQIGFGLSVLIGMAGAIALVAPAGVWIATKIFGYTVTAPTTMNRPALYVAMGVVAVGLILMMGASPTSAE